MVKLLQKIYHTFSQYKIIQWACHVYMNGFLWGDFAAYLRLKKIQNKKKHEGKIKVVFLCQCITVWNKLQSVFEKMIKDERFEVIMLAIPEENSDKEREIYHYFSAMYGEIVRNAQIQEGWINLKELNPDYVFYQRPYDQYLPEGYRSNVVSKYAKICYVSYGYQAVTTTEKSSLNKRFFRNIYMYFAENSIYADVHRNKFSKAHSEGIRKTLNIGYPALEKFMDGRVEKTDSYFNVLWTPRWNEDEDCGGSNFMNFKDKIFELVDEDENVSLTFRPHPMTFSHFVSVGRMTQEEADNYQVTYNNERMLYDKGGNYEKTFWQSDVLLTDMSTIIIEYALTGKPVIYCDTGAKPTKTFEELLKVFYVVKSWEEAKEKVIELRNGIDPLKEERLKRIPEILGNDFGHISEQFLEEIYSNYHTT